MMFCLSGRYRTAFRRRKIEGGAVGRLQHLLARLSKPLPPPFMNSPGGQANGSIDLGRLVRARRLTVTVGHTVPLDCDRDPLSAKSCAAQISAGQTIEARPDPTTTMCNSGCVYVLAGGSTRLIPPWTSLGIHEVGYIPTAGRPEPTKLAIMVGKQIADDHLRAYIREMGIDQRLLTEAFAVPFSSVARLSREDAVRFGLDRREFAKTPWQFFDKPVLAIRKGFFVRTDDSKARYVNGVVSVFCGRGSDNHSVLTFGRDHISTDPADIAGQPPLSLSVNGRDISLARVLNDKLFMRQATLPMTAVDTMVDTVTLVVPGSELGRQQGAAGQQGSGQQSTGNITLNMLGFSQARAKLQDACLHPSTAIAVRTTGIALAALTMPMPLQSLQAGALGARRDASPGRREARRANPNDRQRVALQLHIDVQRAQGHGRLFQGRPPAPLRALRPERRQDHRRDQQHRIERRAGAFRHSLAPDIAGHGEQTGRAVAGRGIIALERPEFRSKQTSNK